MLDTIKKAKRIKALLDIAEGVGFEENKDIISGLAAEAMAKEFANNPDVNLVVSSIDIANAKINELESTINKIETTLMEMLTNVVSITNQPPTTKKQPIVKPQPKIYNGNQAGFSSDYFDED